jgi:hypothetical protein
MNNKIIKNRRIMLVSQKGKLIAEFENLTQAVYYILDNKISSGREDTVMKCLYKAAQDQSKSTYRFLVLIEDVNGVTKEEMDYLVEQSKEAKLQA